LRRRKADGYAAQDFISAGAESFKLARPSLMVRNDSAGKKGGLFAGPPFFFAALRHTQTGTDPTLRSPAANNTSVLFRAAAAVAI
jgi:hypothetical protein